MKTDTVKISGISSEIVRALQQSEPGAWLTDAFIINALARFSADIQAGLFDDQGERALIPAEQWRKAADATMAALRETFPQRGAAKVKVPA